ncbi:MFS hexose transporter [Aureobasidium subglaciale]|nr:MFS hexose transporter [Aureobasidium subglaciale]KAI5213307.1 MFS hexose transporter [Aureobasidium subglaciale]KAI5214653.1 MFS hexose transporter [Aureobasidium subglaciale]KAI5252712.1 MFS hexose transporter [Aureobasidium subglaciale]
MSSMEQMSEKHESKPVATMIENASTHQCERMQHEESVKDAIRNNLGSLAWCCYTLFTCIMWGYDGLAGSVVISLPYFRRDFGTPYGESYVIPAKWQLAFTAGTMIGLVGGGLATGLVASRYGRQVCIGVAYLLTISGVFAQWFANGSLPLFFIGKILTGLPLGVFTSVAPAYCSELAPLALRGCVTAAVNFSIVLGQFFCYCALRQTQTIAGPNSYKILFAVQWGFAAVGLVILPFFPESPYFLISKGKTEKARNNIVKLRGANFDADGHMAQIQIDLTDNQSLEEGGFARCFNKDNRLRTIIACSTFAVSASSGVLWVVGYLSYFLELTGLDPSQVFDTAVGIIALMVVGNMAGWYAIEKLGRRGSFLWGSIVLTVALFMIGILGLIEGAVWGQVAFVCIWAFVYQATVGSACWSMASEIPTSSLRAPTVSLAVMTNGICNAVWSFALPYMINPDEGNMGGKIAFVYGPLLLVVTIFIFFYYPETRGRTFLEIDELFRQRVKPRHFARTQLAVVRA